MVPYFRGMNCSCSYVLSSYHSYSQICSDWYWDLDPQDSLSNRCMSYSSKMMNHTKLNYHLPSYRQWFNIIDFIFFIAIVEKYQFLQELTLIVQNFKEGQKNARDDINTWTINTVILTNSSTHSSWQSPAEGICMLNFL